MAKRKRYSADFKAQVALAAIREELTTAELSKKYDVHPTMIGNWKKQAIANMAFSFGGTSEQEPPISKQDVEKLHAKIGQLVVERDFLSEASSRGRPASFSVLEGKSGEVGQSRFERPAAVSAVIPDAVDILLPPSR